MAHKLPPPLARGEPDPELEALEAELAEQMQGSLEQPDSLTWQVANSLSERDLSQRLPRSGLTERANQARNNLMQTFFRF